MKKTEYRIFRVDVNNEHEEYATATSLKKAKKIAVSLNDKNNHFSGQVYRFHDGWSESDPCFISGYYSVNNL